MAPFVQHVSIAVARTAAEVYAYVSDPAHLPEWAAGLSSGIEQIDGRWVAESPMGPVVVEFAAANPFGVLDHTVTLPTGEIFVNPMRVIDTGGTSVVIFTALRMSGATDAEFDHDAATVAGDLETLKRVMEG